MRDFREQNYYELLDLKPYASQQEVEEAYQRSRRYFSPDSVATYALFQVEELRLLRSLIEEAFRVLGDIEKRRQYDEEASHFREGQAQEFEKPEQLTFSKERDVEKEEVAPERQEEESVPEQEKEESVPAQEKAESVPAQEKAESVPAQEKAESVPAQEKAESVPAQEKAESVPAQEKAESVPAQEKEESVPAQEKEESVPAQEKAESVPAQEKAESVPAQEKAESVPAQEKAESEPEEEAVAPELPPVEEITEFTGELLAQIREVKGVSLEEIAEITKISIYYLRCIESETFEELPAPVYTRGYLRQVARILGLDGERVAASYIERIKRSKD